MIQYSFVNSTQFWGNGDRFLSSTGSGLTPFLLFSVTIFICLVYWNGMDRVARRKRKGSGSDADPNWENLPGLEAIHGPAPWDPTGIVGHILQFFPFEKTMPNCLKWSETYGDIIKFVGFFNQTFVMLNSGPLVQALLKSPEMEHTAKSPEMYHIMKPYVTNGVFVSEGNFWQHQRKLLMKSQTYNNLKAYMPLLNRHAKSFVSDLIALFKDGGSHQINPQINAAFIKMISEMITGVVDEQSEEYTDYHHHFQIWKKLCMTRISRPWLLLNPIWRLHPLSRTHDRVIEDMFKFTRRRVQEHKQNRADMNLKNSESLRCVLDDLTEGGVEEAQIVDEINTLLAAGHETGATTIHCLCFLLALNPDIQRECQKEVDELFENPDNFNNGSLTFEALSTNLKLVERCISETMRLFPPIFVFSRKLKSPLKIHWKGQDHILPAGTHATISPYVLHRKPEYYPEPDKFNPDRFLPEECAKRHAYAYVPFSAGARNCIGLKFAMLEMKIIAAYTLRNFFLQTLDKPEDIPVLPLITTTPAQDYTFQMTRRDVKNIYF